MLRIVALKPQNKKRYAVTFDDGRTLMLACDTVWDFDLREGSELDDKRFTELMKAAVRAKIRAAALKKLSYRDYSSAELKKKLSEDFRSTAVIREIVDRLAEEDIINDERYADRLAYKYIMVKKFGVHRARRELLLHGIDRPAADEALSRYTGSTQENLAVLLEKKYARFLTDRNDRSAIEKVKSSLVRLGYSFTDVNRAIDEFLSMEEQ
jgi:regulatory protein